MLINAFMFDEFVVKGCHRVYVVMLYIEHLMAS